MNTAQLKKFAAEARTILKEGVILRLSALGFRADGSVAEEDRPQKGQGFILFRGEALPDDGFYERWQSLYDRVQKKGLQEVYEEAAYTWFNRLTAIRIMARNGFIPPVLEYVSATTRIPVILSQAREGIFPEMSAGEREQLMAIIDDGRKSQEQFAILITAYCHANPVINKCFGGVTDYTTLLLPQNIIAEGGFIDLLNNTPFIEEEDYKSAELIGWLYQFYISEKKDDVFASFKAGKKAEAEDIPAATQIFTPNWIVKYMVQNTLGRIYLDNNPYDTEIKAQMKYLVEPSEPTPEDAIYRYEKLEDLRLGDLACGSGHILNEFFDLLYLIYIEEGYSRRAAVENIFLKNLTGIDLDTRAKQLAQFALLVKACQKDISFLDAKVMPNVLDMPSPLDEELVHETLPHFFLGGSQQMLQECEEAFKLLEQANNLGSIMKFEISDSNRVKIRDRINEIEKSHELNNCNIDFYHSLKLILALTGKYTCLVANPPYMGKGNMNKNLSSYLEKNYPNTKQDLFSTFMQIMLSCTEQKGKSAFVTMESWMFLSSFEKFRIDLLDNNTIESMIHMPYLGKGWTPMGISFGTDACVVFRGIKDYIANYQYIRYYETNKEDGKPNSFPLRNERYSNINQEYFKSIPGCQIGYWISKKIIDIFKYCKPLSYYCRPAQGMATADNGRFLRYWCEVDWRKAGISYQNQKEASQSLKKWFPYNKGGQFRKWYGNQDFLVNWYNNGQELRNFKGSVIRNPDTYFSQSISWSKVTSVSAAFRYFPYGFIYDVAGTSLFANDKEMIPYYTSLVNSNVMGHILNLLSPTLNYEVGQIACLPIIVEKVEIISDISLQNISISKQDWDAHETSWDFKTNELVAINEDNFLDIINDYADFRDICIDPTAPEQGKLEWHFNMYKMKWETLFYRLKQNEEELNRQFIEIYGLQDELEEFVRTDEVTILQQGEIDIVTGPGDDSGYGDTIRFNKDVVIKQLISYAISCWMGRYRLDKPGLYIAHPDAKTEEICSYEYNGQQFEIDDDGIIPLLPSYASFADNGINRIVDFLRIAFGPEKLTENINFVEDALGMTIEKFMVKEFWKYHKKMYQNRPIYWLFSSKKGAFQCLTYMHRMNAYTVEQIRSKYLLPHIDWLKNHVSEMESRASQLTTQERKLKDQMQKDLAECIEYHNELHVVADHNITFDLDDGVVKNYALFGNVLAKLK